MFPRLAAVLLLLGAGVVSAGTPPYKYLCGKNSGGVQSAEWRGTLKDATGKPAGYFSICWDLTDGVSMWLNMKGIKDFGYIVLNADDAQGATVLGPVLPKPPELVLYEVIPWRLVGPTVKWEQGFAAAVSHWWYGNGVATDLSWKAFFKEACVVAGGATPKSTRGFVRVYTLTVTNAPVSLSKVYLELKKGDC